MRLSHLLFLFSQFCLLGQKKWLLYDLRVEILWLGWLRTLLRWLKIDIECKLLAWLNWLGLLCWWLLWLGFAKGELEKLRDWVESLRHIIGAFWLRSIICLRFIGCLIGSGLSWLLLLFTALGNAGRVGGSLFECGCVRAVWCLVIEFLQGLVDWAEVGFELFSQGAKHACKTVLALKVIGHWSDGLVLVLPFCKWSLRVNLLLQLLLLFCIINQFLQKAFLSLLIWSSSLLSGLALLARLGKIDVELEPQRLGLLLCLLQLIRHNLIQVWTVQHVLEWFQLLLSFFEFFHCRREVAIFVLWFLILLLGIGVLSPDLKSEIRRWGQLHLPEVSIIRDGLLLFNIIWLLGLLLSLLVLGILFLLDLNLHYVTLKLLIAFLRLSIDATAALPCCICVRLYLRKVRTGPRGGSIDCIIGSLHVHLI